jgi:hypothetical protein
VVFSQNNNVSIRSRQSGGSEINSESDVDGRFRRHKEFRRCVWQNYSGVARRDTRSFIVAG